MRQRSSFITKLTLLLSQSSSKSGKLEILPMAGKKNAIRRVEDQVYEGLSALKAIAFQITEFAIFIYGLVTIVRHTLK